MSKLSEKKSLVAREKKRNPDGSFATSDKLEEGESKGGKWVKGMKSPNPKGRPRKKVESDSDLPPDFHERVGCDAVKAFEVLLETCTSRYEAAKLAKEVAAYQRPKLSNVEAFSTEVKTIEIKWTGEVESIPAPIIEGEIEEVK